MYIKRIVLHGFRNLAEKQINFSESLTVIVGENAQGKTNILEAIHCGINGEGFRETREEELLQIGKEFFQIDLLVSTKHKKKQFRIFFQKQEAITHAVNKTYFVEGARKTHRQYKQEQLRSVLFTPEHIEIITGSPEKRRSYLDSVISSVDLLYKNHLHNYMHALRRRNKLLEHSGTDEELDFWNDYLIKEGSYISEARIATVSFFNENPHLDGKEFCITYTPNIFSKERLDAAQDIERKTKKTMIGPQKDDFSLALIDASGKKDVHLYGSRSEQRLSILWLKINEILLLQKRLRIAPVLLLDDIFSEFDHENKERILRLITQYQTVMTTTERQLLEDIKRHSPSFSLVSL